MSRIPSVAPFDQAIAIGILDSQDHRAAESEPFCLSLGKEPVEEGRASAADMEQPGRAGGVADADGTIDRNGRIGHGASEDE